MSLNLNKSTWGRVSLGQVARHITDRVDPETSRLERFLAGEHIPSGSLAITDWGVIGRDPVGPMFYKRFKPGHVLYVSRRTYLRKVAVPDFEGITGEKTFVLESIDTGTLLQAFLPFVVSAEVFHEYAIRNSRGSVNPYLNWGELAAYEFDLPPLDEQTRIANLLWALEKHRIAVRAVAARATGTARSLRADYFSDQSGVPASQAFNITIGRQRSPQHQVGEHIVPYLRSANVTSEGIDLSDVKLMNFDPSEQAKFALLEGDVLVSEGSASADAVGLPAVWRGQLSGVVCFQNTLLRFRAKDGVTIQRYVEQWCRWAFDSREFLRVSAGTSIYHIGAKGAASMRVRVPITEDQTNFVRRTSLAEAAAAGAADEQESLVELRVCLLAEIFGDD